MNIREWPAEERPREKLLIRGPEVLSDAELLAVFFGTGLPGRNAIDLGRELLARHGGLRGLLSLPTSDLVKQAGVGPARTARLVAALELATRHLAAGLDRPGAITHPRHAGEYFRARLRDRPREVFAALYLDTRHRALGFEELFQGSIDGAEVHPRVLVERALAQGAATVIVGHNHPSGNPDPSAADRAVTTRLKQALALVDVRLLDHFVIGDGPPSSMAARGWV